MPTAWRPEAYSRRSFQLKSPISAILALALLITPLLACSFTKNLLNKSTMFEGTTAKYAADAFKKNSSLTLTK